MGITVIKPTVCISNSSMVFGDILPLPACTEPYAFQVAGHSRENSGNFEILRDKSRPFVYKSLQDCSRGMREVIFYERVFSPDAPEAFKLLRHYIPTYHGIFQCPSTKAYYIGLSDLVASFKQPNVCDFKMGTVTYFPGSPEDKIAREQFKYAWRRKLGFLLSGMQVYDTRTHCSVKVPKSFGRSLTPEQVYSVGLKTFLGSNPVYRIEVAQKYIVQLGRILSWYIEYGAKTMTFCRSSLLLIHESSANYNVDCHTVSPISLSTSFSSSEQSLSYSPLLEAANDMFSSPPYPPPPPPTTTTTIEDVTAVSVTTTSIKSIAKPNHISNSQHLLCNTTSCSRSSISSAHTHVYLIDFAHWEEKSATLTGENVSDNNTGNYRTCELTEGFRHGLETLIALMRRVVNNEERQ
ncbi:unnamed protein product [Heterobilharzia americana]|nr:unnamed protein product [Heterobilharzia americana]